MIVGGAGIFYIYFYSMLYYYSEIKNSKVQHTISIKFYTYRHGKFKIHLFK